jgi:hypothetical protein
MHITKFPHEVTTELACYVYRLIDPRNGETFYVGKGSGDRIFHHCIADAKYLEGSEFGNKLKRIREIRALGLDVGHIIHRHGMDDATASEVEAALIDAYVGLTNLVAGAQSDTRGSMHVTEIINRYSAETAEFGHDLMLITVNRTVSERSMYEATRFAWKVNPENARRAKYVLAVNRGLIVGAYERCNWMEATASNFPDHGDDPGRWGFEGHDATYDIQRLYVGKRVPDEYRKPGAANPFRYVREGKVVQVAEAG